MLTDALLTRRSPTDRRNRTKRCHGNRRLRRFRKKCRRRGMDEEEIQTLMEHWPHREPGAMEAVQRHLRTTETRARNKRRASTKRKRMLTSSSSRSLVQRSPKRRKPPSDEPLLHAASLVPIHDRPPNYLTKSPAILYQALRLQLQHKLNKKAEQRFLSRRLQLFDRQYRLEMHRQLWHSYRRLGTAYQIWPVCSSSGHDP